MQITIRAPRWRRDLMVDSKVLERVWASADSFMNCDTKCHEKEEFSVFLTHFMCFVKRDDAACSHILLEKDAQADVKEGASPFWSDTGAR